MSLNVRALLLEKQALTIVDSYSHSTGGVPTAPAALAAATLAGSQCSRCADRRNPFGQFSEGVGKVWNYFFPQNMSTIFSQSEKPMPATYLDSTVADSIARAGRSGGGWAGAPGAPNRGRSQSSSRGGAEWAFAVRSVIKDLKHVQCI